MFRLPSSPSDIILRDVIEQPTTLTNHKHQATTRMVIALMNLKMLSELGNALGEDGNLNIGGTRVIAKNDIEHYRELIARLGLRR
jgi:hypothetical protein